MLPQRAAVREAIPRAPQTEESGLAAALLATLAYHDLLDLPLTAVGCWRYLLRPRGAEFPIANSLRRRPTPKPGSQFPIPTLRDVEAALADLVAARQIEARNGFYFFPGRGDLYEAWIEKHARSQEKWHRLRRVIFWLQWLPFLRGVAVTGSLAFDNAKETSDLDVLIVAETNRVWTVRFVLTVLLDAFGLRRRPAGPTADRVCLNHYLAADALAFPYRSLYTALEYARLVPLLGETACRAFRAANRSWMEEYLVRVFPDTLSHGKTLHRPFPFRVLQAGLELPLRTPLGGALERAVKSVQRARIRRAAAVPGRVVATDARAEFHPHSREAVLLRAFNDRMGSLAIADRFGRQNDSGLVT